MSQEKETIDLAKGYTMLCVVCGESVARDDGSLPPREAVRNITLGPSPDEAWIAAVVVLCTEHQVIKDHVTPFMERMEKMIAGSA